MRLAVPSTHIQAGAVLMLWMNDSANGAEGARYDPHAIERRWQQVWEEEGTWQVPNPGDPGWDDSTPRSYVLEMLPYPSGEPHMGHLKNYTMGDVLAHYRRRNGMQVLHPMGYDAFGLPAENHAIKTGEQPAVSTQKSIEEFRRQFKSWGVSIDWTREFGTHEPCYYRWTQWIFLQLYERGLAYRKKAPVKWCPKDQTVLANEQVIDGHCERCGTEVIVRQLEQWFFKITDYAERLLDDFKLLESWPERVITMQRNWIGRSEGAEATFRCERAGDRLRGLHDPARHPVRRDLLRDGARASRPRAADRRHRARGRGHGLRPAGAARVGRAALRHREGEDGRVHRPPRRSTPSTASRSRSTSPTTC